MSSKFRWLSKVVMVAAIPALILTIVFLLPPALAAATDHAAGTAVGHAPVALSALAALHSLAATPAPAAPPTPAEPPEPPAPRGYRVHSHSSDDDDDAAESAWLGVTLSEIDEEGARVAAVAEDSPADEAGLRKGDRIIAVEGKKVISSRDVVRTVRSASPGDKISIRILRDGDEKTLSATLAGRKMRERHEFRYVTPEGEDIDIDVPDIDMHEMDETPGAPGHHMRMMTWPSRTWLGVEIHPMSPELREALKAPSDKGLLVNRVVEDSPAQAAGLKAGDIIIEVGDKDIDEVGDIGQALRDREEGDSVEVKVIRNGSERTLNVKLDDRPERRGRRGFYMPELKPEERAAIEKSVHEAMEAAHKALREANEQLRVESDRMRSEQYEVREQIQKEMKELKEKLKSSPPVIIRAKTVYDI